jgi:hypothetical protein
MFDILDILLGLFFVYLLLSLVCTAIMEYIAALTNKRGKELVRGIEQALGDTGAARFFDHPLIRSFYPDLEEVEKREQAIGNKPWIMRPFYRLYTWLFPSGSRPRRPSYLPARTFALALAELLDSPEPAAEGTTDIKKIVATLARDSGTDVTEFANLQFAARLASPFRSVLPSGSTR